MVIYQGKTKSFRVLVRDYLKQLQDLTGYTLTFTVKSSLTDADIDAVISKTGTVLDPTSGTASWVLNPTDTNIDTGSYWYDIQMSKSGESLMIIEPTELAVAEPVRDAE